VKNYNVQTAAILLVGAATTGAGHDISSGILLGSGIALLLVALVRAVYILISWVESKN
jgi:hypothetical protein